MIAPRVLFSIPTRHHIEIAIDEMHGLEELGYTCSHFQYSARAGVESTLGRLWVMISNAFALVRKAYKFKPDIIYLNSRVELLAGMRDALTLSIFRSFYYHPVKFIIKSHGSDLERLKTPDLIMGRMITPYLNRRISAWLFLSEEEKNEVEALHCYTPGSVFVTKNIVRTDQFRYDSNFKAGLGIPKDHSTCLFVGRLIAEKGIYEVLEAFARISKKYNAVLIIVGWGPELAELNQTADLLEITDKVRFTGFIPETEVVNYYANCDLLIFPTYFPEGFPMALFNSVSAGMCVVTTPIRAAKDHLAEPDNCIWVEARNSHSVFNAIDTLFASTNLRSQMRSNNIQKGREFTKQRVCQELAEIIQLINKQNV
jgi:glycosyltransferase involved in cell wall biosynthesis